MSRPTDTERGARIARDEALHALHPDLFGFRDGEGGQWDQLNDFWWSIFHAANAELADCAALRLAVAHG